VESAAAVDAEDRAHSGLENDRTVFHSYHRHLTDGHSISASYGWATHAGRPLALRLASQAVSATGFQGTPWLVESGVDGGLLFKREVISV